MRSLILAAAMIVACTSTAQNNTASNIIEGGKTLVELVRVFKTPKQYTASQQNLVEKKDSCAIKNITDLCIKNSTANPLVVTLYKRNGNGYEANVLSMKILPKNQEWLYEIKCGIYKIKLETEEDEEKKSNRQKQEQKRRKLNGYASIKQESMHRLMMMFCSAWVAVRKMTGISMRSAIAR